MNNLTEKPVDYVEIISEVWKKKYFILKTVLIVTFVTIGLSLLVSNKYRVAAVVLPDNESSKLGNLGGLADIASMAGVSVGGGGKSWMELYPQIMVSEAVLKNVIYTKYKSEKFKDSVNIIEYFELDDKNYQKNYDRAFEALNKNMEIILDKKTKVLTVSIVSDEPQLAANIINTALKRLDDFIRTKRISSASERRKWVDQRLADVKIDLSHAENSLKEFRERNRMVAGSPQLLLEQQRLMRDVEINSTIFVELKKQLELAKIDEINTMPIINILDAARETTIKESPKRGTYVLLMVVISLIISAGYVILQYLYSDIINSVREKINLILTSNKTV